MPIKDSAARKSYNLAWRNERRARVLAYLGGHCVVCGTTEDLEFHHKDPNDKLFGIARILGRRWSIMTAELDKCELRCQKHHHDEHGISHGTDRMYRASCRCDLCIIIQTKRRVGKKLGRLVDPMYGRSLAEKHEFERRREGAGEPA